ncbi:MAG: hypothetical protein U1F68_00245 [Gammaproteobacteria bacterium]
MEWSAGRRWSPPVVSMALKLGASLTGGDGEGEDLRQVSTPPVAVPPGVLTLEKWRPLALGRWCR